MRGNTRVRYCKLFETGKLRLNLARIKKMLIREYYYMFYYNSEVLVR